MKFHFISIEISVKEEQLDKKEKICNQSHSLMKHIFISYSNSLETLDKMIEVL
jgi:hypothetical protein